MKELILLNYANLWMLYALALFFYTPIFQLFQLNDEDYINQNYWI